MSVIRIVNIFCVIRSNYVIFEQYLCIQYFDKEIVHLFYYINWGAFSAWAGEVDLMNDMCHVINK